MHYVFAANGVKLFKPNYYHKVSVLFCDHHSLLPHPPFVGTGTHDKIASRARKNNSWDPYIRVLPCFYSVLKSNLHGRLWSLTETAPDLESGAHLSQSFLDMEQVSSFLGLSFPSGESNTVLGACGSSVRECLWWFFVNRERPCECVGCCNNSDFYALITISAQKYWLRLWSLM